MTQEAFPTGKFQALQNEIMEKIKASPVFAHVTVLTEQVKDIDNIIEAALGTITEKDGKMGVCAIVITPRARATKPNMRGPYFDNVSIVIRIIENATINQGDSGHKLPCSYFAERVANLLHLTQTTSNHVIIVYDLALVPDETNVIYDVTAKTAVGLSDANQK